MKKLTFFLFPLLLASTAHAQLGLGLEAGCNLSNLQVQPQVPHQSIKSHTGLGFCGGAIVHIAANRDFSVFTGLLYSVKTMELAGMTQGFDMTSRITLRSMQWPLYVAVQPKPGRSGRMSIGAGTFVDLHLSGKEQYNGASHALDIGDATTDDFKSFDFGLGLHAGYKLNNGLMFRAQYQLGLTNISPSPGGKIMSRNFAITIAYLGPRQSPKAPSPANTPTAP
jgi:hypothetical protein